MDVEEVRHKVELRDVCKCSELKLRCEKAENKCEELELKIQIKKIEYELLQGQMKKLESEKSVIETELKAWMEKSHERGQQVSCGKDGRNICFEDVKMEVVNLVDNNEIKEEIFQLLIENNVLAVEKKNAENEAELWKGKFKHLEIQFSKMDERKGDGKPVLCGKFEGRIGLSMSHETCASDGVASNHYAFSKEIRTPPNGSSPNPTLSFGQGRKRGTIESHFEHGNRVRKQLSFEEESPSKKMAPLTPGVSRPLHGVINIDDSDDEVIIAKLPSHTQEKSEACVSAPQDLSECVSICFEEKIDNGNKITESDCHTNNAENVEALSDDFISNSTLKRKRALNILTSDTETDDDDNVPIGKLKIRFLQKTNCTQVLSDLNNDPTSTCDKVVVSAIPTRRRLVSLRNYDEKGSEKENSASQIVGIKNGMTDAEDELEDVASVAGSDTDSFEGFIVESSDDSDVGSTSQSEDSEDLSNGGEGYDEIMSKLGRRKKELKWEYEADMLASFGKDPELCMKAVCALYRQQTSEEKISKETLFSNKRGFSKFDAIRGTRLAEFLTNGDPQGNLNKSVKELEEYDPKAIELCRNLATHYSKQLFEIYGNKEDPFFLLA
ncbi:protein IWS1-like protein A isoform X1 [Cucumis melo var. makuwa]|uniref:Protein IWS1-like protein A isoform X1 n=1 Tax=Cucumis melo var. makuwa TaxID=1194695 RepID=A0A5A7UA97_CUCMM|nr:protein IWS1-like protein A isoform X1 [Cucumis melo var. makuwa]